MEVYMKIKAPDLKTGLLTAKGTCQCKRKSFIGVRIVTPLSEFKYSWHELDFELRKIETENQK